MVGTSDHRGELRVFKIIGTDFGLCFDTKGYGKYTVFITGGTNLQLIRPNNKTWEDVGKFGNLV